MRVLKFQKDPYFAHFQGQFLKNYPLFRVKTRTILLSKIPPFFYQFKDTFKKYPYLCKNNTEITQVPRRFRLKASPERGFYRDLPSTSLETSERLRLFLHFYATYSLKCLFTSLLLLENRETNARNKCKTT